MANKNRVAGQSKIRIDGDLLDTDGSSTLELGGPTRSAVNGDYQAGAFREMTAESKLETTILVKAGTRLTDLRQVDNATISFETDVGIQFVVRNAYVADVISFNSGEGKAKIVLQGPPAEQV